MDKRTIKKVLLIRSSNYDTNGRLVKANSLLDRFTVANLAELGLPMIAAATPSHIEVEMVDDCLEETPFDTDADVIGISAMLIHIKRALDLARIFREKGKIVIMGGYLATHHPEMVIDHVDSVCIGEGEEIWKTMLADIESGTLKKSYCADYSQPLDNLPIPRYDLIKRNRFINAANMYPVQATRGCPYRCDYCSIAVFFKHSYRARPVADVIRDIQSCGSKFIYFVDDNLFDNRTHAKELMLAMRGLKVEWGVQATINIANDAELLDLAYDAGCRMLMIGMESLNRSNLKDLNKSWTKPEEYSADIKKIQDRGIGVHALIIFGLPHDTPAVFEDTVNFLIDANAAAVDFFILTPYPATPLGKKYLEEGLITTFDYSLYREPHLVFKHPTMSEAEIQEEYWKALKKFYSFRSIVKRVFRGMKTYRMQHLINNLYYWFKVKRKIIPTHFQRSTYPMKGI